MDVIEVESLASPPDISITYKEIPPVLNAPENTENYHCFPSESSQVWSPREIFPENIAFIDKKNTFCRARKTQELSYPKSLDAELVSNPNLCQQVFELSLYQNILFRNSSNYVRFTKGYTELSFQSKINKTPVSDELKELMYSVSIKCSQMLRDVGLLCDYIELDAQKDFFILSRGNMINIRTTLHVLSLSEQSQPWQTTKSDSEEESDDERDYGYLKISSRSTRANQRKKKSQGGTDTGKITKPEYKEPSTINIMLSLRNWIPAKEVFLKYMISLANPNHNTYLLICHLGPLVETPRIALYQYMISNHMKRLCTTQSEETEPVNEVKMKAYGEFHYKENSDEESDDSSPDIAVVETADFKYVTEKKEEDAKRKNKKVQIGGHTICETPIPDPEYVQTIVIPVESDSSEEEDEAKLASHQNSLVMSGSHDLCHRRDQFSKTVNEDDDISQNSNRKTDTNEFTVSTPDDKEQEIQSDKATGGQDSCPDQSQLLKLTLEEIWHHWEINEGQFVYKETKLKECIRNYIYDVPPLPRRMKSKTEKK